MAFEKLMEIGSELTEKLPKIMRSWQIIFNLTGSIVDLQCVSPDPGTG